LNEGSEKRYNVFEWPVSAAVMIIANIRKDHSMKTIVLFYLIIAATFWGNLGVRAADVIMLDVASQQASAIYNLAKERFESHKAQGSICVMGFLPQNKRGVQRVTDGVVTLVLIEKDDLADYGLQLYVRHYNGFVVQHADAVALEKKNYQAAITLYKTIVAHGNSSDGFVKLIKRRIELSEMLLKGENIPANIAEFKTMLLNYGPSALEGMETVPAVKVPNILDY
jgi:hypothetical protein